MKKKILFLLICLLVCPFMVHADSGMPSRPEMKAKIINLDGAKVYDYNPGGVYKENGMTLPYDKIITIDYEYNYYGGYYDDDKDEYCYVKLEDTEYIWDLSKYTFKDDGTVYTIEETDVYEYPSMSSSVIGKIDADKVVNIKMYVYIDNSDEETDYYSGYNLFNGWNYVEYNEIKGWIYTSMSDNFGLWENEKSKHSTIAVSTNEQFITVEPGTYVSDTPISLKRINTLDKNVKFTATYYYYNINSDKQYYYNNDIKGWIEYSDIAQKTDEYILIVDNEVKGYDSLFAWGTTTTIKNKNMKTYKAEYRYCNEDNSDTTTYYYVKIDGAYYWLTSVYNDGNIISYYGEYDIIVEDNINYYSNVNLASDSYIGYLTPNSYKYIYIKYLEDDNESLYYFVGYGYGTLSGKYDPTEHYEYKNYNVKFLADVTMFYDEDRTMPCGLFEKNNEYTLDVAYVGKVENNENLYYDKIYGYFVLGMSIDELKYIDSSKLNEKVKDENVKEAVYYIGGAIVLALASFTTILLINKKSKKEKLSEVKKEDKTEVLDIVEKNDKE